MGEHIIRLLTFRHNGEGLTTKIFPVFVTLLLACAAVAATRWSITGESKWVSAFANVAVVQVIMFGLFTQIGPPNNATGVSNGYAIISMAVDLMALFLFLVFSGHPKGTLLIYEGIASGIFLYKFLSTKKETG